MSDARWLLVTKERPCVICGKSRGCRNAPDATAAVCWHNGNDGKVIQVEGASRTNGKNANGTDAYVGAAHRKSKSAPKCYPTSEDAIRASAWNLAEAKLTAVWSYPGEAFKIARFDNPNGKHIRPVHRVAGAWRVGDPAGPLPLYFAEPIPHDVKMVFGLEGEKCTDIAASIGLPSFTSSHGAASAAKSDWNPVADRDTLIVFLPDHDEAGEKYVADACRIIFQRNPKARIKVVNLPDLPPGGDIEQYIDARDSMESSAIAASIISLVAKAEFVSNPARELAAVSSVELLREFVEMRRPLIKGLLRMTETANIIAAAKVGKTHLALDLTISVITGRPWLGQFEIVNPGPVLYVDAELHQETMSRRIAGVCAARGIYADQIAGKMDVLSLRGKLKDIFTLAPWFSKNAVGKYSMIILDALYRLIPEGVDENSNSDMTRVFNVIDQIAETTGAAVVVVHHTSKGVQASKSVVDVGSGASAAARATDSHIVFRQHEEDGCVVLDMAARSWPPISPPLALRFTYPVWNPDDRLDPEALRQEGRKKRKEESPESTPEPQIKWTPETFVETFLADDGRTESVIITKASIVELSERQTKRLLSAAVDTGIAHKWTYADRKKPHRFSTIAQPLIEAGNEVAK